MTPLQVGDTVRLRVKVLQRRSDGTPGTIDPRDLRATSRIQLFYRDIDGGVRLESELDGFVSWNRKDLAVVRRAPRPEASP